MAVLNNSVIKESQIKSLETQIIEGTNRLDLNYFGYDHTNPDSGIVVNRDKANVNRVLFWLASKKDDYIRESFKGGILYSLLGTLCNTTNLSEWEQTISSRFNSAFSGDMSIMYIKLYADKNYRRILVTMAVKDIIENSIFTVSTEATT